MNNEYTTQWFRDKLFDYALDLYKRHWERYGKYDCHRPGAFVESQSFQDSWYDNDIVHSALDEQGESIYKQMDKWIEYGELEIYLHEQMQDYAETV